ncbi:MAG: hypothetical protein V1904_04935 [Bacteroidota bacterium]
MYRQILVPIILLAISSCGIPKETLIKFNNTPNDTVVFPIDYCLSLPVLDTSEWNNNYITYDKFLSDEITRTQAGISNYLNGVYTYMCVPSANPYVQIDSLTMISDNTKIIGDWKIVCNRTISFESVQSAIIKELTRRPYR